MNTKEILEFLKSIEYIDLDDVFDGVINDLTPDYFSRFSFCPCCGYKNTDGHYQDCELSKLIEAIERQAD